MPKGRRRLVLIALVVIACGGALLTWIWEREESPEVKLVFLGYTNELIGVYNLGPSFEVSSWTPKAIIGITNGGETPILPIPWSKGVKLGANGKYLYAPQALIPPGAMNTTTSHLSTSDNGFEATFAYTRLSRIAKLINQLKSSSIGSIARVLPSPQLQWAQSVWVTNPPPEKRFHIDAPPPPFKFEPPSRETNTMVQ